MQVHRDEKESIDYAHKVSAILLYSWCHFCFSFKISRAQHFLESRLPPDSCFWISAPTLVAYMPPLHNMAFFVLKIQEWFSHTACNTEPLKFNCTTQAAILPLYLCRLSWHIYIILEARCKVCKTLRRAVGHSSLILESMWILSFQSTKHEPFDRNRK